MNRDFEDSIRDGYDTPYVDEPDKLNEDFDDAGGTTPERYSLPDQAPNMELVLAIATAVYQQVENERKRIASIKDSQHAGAYVQFTRYELTAPMRAVMICREKANRRSVTLTFIGGTNIWVGKHAGIMPRGQDTTEVGMIAVAPGTSINLREFPTKEALYAISEAVAGTPSIFDITESFDS